MATKKAKKATTADAINNVAHAICDLAAATNEVANELKMLGNGNAHSVEGFGALETFGLHIGEKIDELVRVIGKK